MFTDIMIEYEYVECTSSVIEALELFRKLYPEHRKYEVDKCIENAAKYIEHVQNSDGSWYD